MRTRLQRVIEQHPLALLLMVGFVLRMIAAAFARGYMATDDHNQVIELAAEWSRGDIDYLTGHEQFYRSLLYPALNWLQMSACHAVGIIHPDAVMFINRVLHALFSLWTIVLTYRIGLRISDHRAAFTAGLVVAAHAVMPYVAVRNLIEIVCMPFLLWGILHVLRARDKSGNDRQHWFIAGIAFGIAFLIRWQIASAVAGIGVFLLIKREWNGVGLMSLGGLVAVLAEGIWCWQTHGVFLGSLWQYIAHNAVHARDYVVGPWYRYLLLIAGVFIPPFSLLCMYAAGKYIRRLGILAWAVIPFLLVHSLVPGKQERFLLPIFPLLALLFVIALWHWERGNPRIERWTRYGWRWFWTVNAGLLLGALTHYGQRGKIEPLIGIFEQGDARGILIDLTERGRRTDLPLFYLDGGGVRPLPDVVQFTSESELDSVVSADQQRWNYAVVFSRGEFENHQTMLETRMGELEIIRHTGPTWVESVLMTVNPRYTHSRESWLCRIRQ